MSGLALHGLVLRAKNEEGQQKGSATGLPIKYSVSVDTYTSCEINECGHETREDAWRGKKVDQTLNHTIAGHVFFVHIGRTCRPQRALQIQFRGF